MKPPVMEVRDLKTYFRAPSGAAKAVDGVSFTIEAGSTFALVGESGCGKSVTALSIIQLIDEPGFHAGGEILFHGIDVARLPEKEKRRMRGNSVSMIFQEPMTSLNPVFTVGDQVAEAIRLHQGASAAEAKARAIEMLAKVRLPDPTAAFDAYPHKLSGGMRQRAMIAMALSCKPELLIADEPTTALDVTIQAEILRLIEELKRESGAAVLLITHNLALVYNHAKTVGVMYGGKIVERAYVNSLFNKPLHPYTQRLMTSIPGSTGRGAPLKTIPGAVPPATNYPSGCRFAGRCHMEMTGCASVEPQLVEREKGHWAACHLHDPAFMASPLAERAARAADDGVGAEPERAAAGAMSGGAPIVEVKGLKTYYPVKKGLFKRVVGHVKAVDGIDLAVEKGQTLALVGESGCGKTTAGKTIMRLVRPTGGSIVFKGADVTALSEKEFKPHRSSIQMIFQDPYSSLDPRMRVSEIIEEGILSLRPELGREERRRAAEAALERVGLSSEMMDRYPHEFSGGQRQRIGIARALAVEPEFIVCDEAVSALDVSVQAQILNLLKSIQAATGVSYLFITHDLGVVEYIADEVAVMHMGRIVERGPVEELFSNPAHEYTKKLLSAVPRISRK